MTAMENKHVKSDVGQLSLIRVDVANLGSKIKNTSFDIWKRNFIVGPSLSGKSTLIQVFSLLKAICDNRLYHALQAIRKMCPVYDSAYMMKVCFDFKDEDNNIWRYHIQFNEAIKEEHMVFMGKKERIIESKVSPLYSESIINSSKHHIAYAIKNYVDSWGIYSFALVDIKNYLPDFSQYSKEDFNQTYGHYVIDFYNDKLKEKCENIFDRLYAIYRQKSDVYRNIMKYICKAFFQVYDLSFYRNETKLGIYCKTGNRFFDIESNNGVKGTIQFADGFNVELPNNQLLVFLAYLIAIIDNDFVVIDDFGYGLSKKLASHIVEFAVELDKSFIFVQHEYMNYMHKIAGEANLILFNVYKNNFENRDCIYEWIENKVKGMSSVPIELEPEAISCLIYRLALIDVVRQCILQLDDTFNDKIKSYKIRLFYNESCLDPEAPIDGLVGVIAHFNDDFLHKGNKELNHENLDWFCDVVRDKIMDRINPEYRDWIYVGWA